MWWIKINSVSTDYDESAALLVQLQIKYNAHFNTLDDGGMWYDFETSDNAQALFVKLSIAYILNVPAVKVLHETSILW